MPDLDELLRRHLADPFPPSISKGDLYAEVDPVVIDADIYGWASSARDDVTLDSSQMEGLRRARNELVRSLRELPADAVPYFRRLVDIADLVLRA